MDSSTAFMSSPSRVGVEWLMAPVALLVGLNAVGGAAAYLSSTSRLPFVAGIDHYLPPAFGWVHPRYRTPWVAIVSYGLAGTVVALLGQAGTTVRGAYDVLVSMAILLYFLPYLFLFASMIRLQREPAGTGSAPRAGRQAGGHHAGIDRPASTSLTIFLSVIPAEDEPHKVMAVMKVVGGTAVMIGIGAVLLLIARYKGRKLAQPICAHRVEQQEACTGSLRRDFPAPDEHPRPHGSGNEVGQFAIIR